MEIHHHPKRSDKPRKINEYIFEFLVIFIAITGSFFAENLREHFVDRSKEKEFMESLLQDLQTDTTNLSRIIALNKDQLLGLDSLTETLKCKLTRNNLLRFYNLNQIYASKFYGFNPVTTTMTQLLSTGSLRIIKEKSISDGIINFDKAERDALQIREFVGSQFYNIMDQQAEIFDFLSIDKQSCDLHLSKGKDFPIMLNTDKNALNAYYYKLKSYAASVHLITFQLDALKNQASSLIRMIKVEYNIE